MLFKGTLKHEFIVVKNVFIYKTVFTCNILKTVCIFRTEPSLNAFSLQ